jgi:hypothetical protein
MEIGAFFILVLLVIVLAVLGGGVYLIAAKLRHDQLHPEGDRVEPAPDGDGRRPQHRRVSSEQQAEFVHDR